jgi:hypothetical protein
VENVYELLKLSFMDLIDKYLQSGLVSSPVRGFRSCAGCGARFHPDDLHTVDIETYDGSHDTIEVCDECYEGGGFKYKRKIEFCVDNVEFGDTIET